MLFYKKYFFSITILLLSNIIYGQSIPPGFNSLDYQLRELQLEGKISNKYSFFSRPYQAIGQIQYDSILSKVDSTFGYKNIIYTNNKKTNFQVLPVSFITKLNTHHPYGWNQQGFIDAKGLQTYLSGGVYGRWGILSAQLIPEFVYANNPNFESTNSYGSPTKGAYKKVFPGQSYVSLAAGNIALSVSSENMWWGPGIENSLLMSNNAPGFLHIKLHSRGPIKTPVGNIEFSLLSGRLEEDTSVLLQVKNLTTYYYAQGNYSGYPSIPSLDSTNWRYLNALTFSYNPKFAPSLYLGFTRVGYTYNNYLGNHGDFLQDYLPVFIGFFRSNSKYYKNDGSNTKTKQIVSFSARYLFQKSNAELYAEYGYGDNTSNIEDLTLSIDHGAVFSAGFKKLTPLSKSKWLVLETEITQLTQSFNNQYRGTGGDWYLYQGSYTNQSRILGAGFGMASNMLTVKATIKEGFGRMGIVLQRIIHSASLEPYFSENKRWIDYSLGFIYAKKVKNIVIQSKTQLVHSDNYAWKINEQRFNFNSQVGFLYFLSKKH